MIELTTYTENKGFPFRTFHFNEEENNKYIELLMNEKYLFIKYFDK